MPRRSTNAHLSDTEVYYLLTPLSGDPEIIAIRIFCDGSGQMGCCYPTYIREGEELLANQDRFVEEWTEEGDYFVVRGGDREN